jgi:hypothetical protein
LATDTPDPAAKAAAKVAKAAAKARERLRVRPASARSRNTNCTTFLAGVDPRSSQARRMYDITAQVAVDLGGVDHISETRLALIRRFATLCVILEQMEVHVAAGTKINESMYAKMSSVLGRLGGRIGLRRVPKTIMPDLREHIMPQPDGGEPDAHP